MKLVGDGRTELPKTGGPPHLAGWLWLNALTAQQHLCQPACFLPLISDFPFLPKDVCKFLNFNSVTQICHSVESSASNFPGTMGAFEGQTVLSSREFFCIIVSSVSCSGFLKRTQLLTYPHVA